VILKGDRLKKYGYFIIALLGVITLGTVYSGVSFLSFKQDYYNLLDKQAHFFFKLIENELTGLSTHKKAPNNTNRKILDSLLASGELANRWPTLPGISSSDNHLAKTYFYKYIKEHKKLSSPFIYFSKGEKKDLFVFSPYQNRWKIYVFDFSHLIENNRNFLPKKFYFRIADSNDKILFTTSGAKIARTFHISFFDKNLIVSFFSDSNPILLYIKKQFFLFFFTLILLISFLIILFNLFVFHSKILKKIIEKNNYEVRALKDYINNILNLSPNIIISLNSDGNVTYWNKRAVDFFKIPIDEILHNNLFNKFSILDQYHADFLNVVKDRKTIVHLEEEYSGNGEIEYLDIVLYPVRDTDVVIDINIVTERVKLKKKQLKFFKFEMMEKFLKRLTHKYNNMISGLVGYVELAELESSPEVLKSYLKELENISSDLLTFTKRLESFVVEEDNESLFLVNCEDILFMALKSLDNRLAAKINYIQRYDHRKYNIFGNYNKLVKIFSDFFPIVTNKCNNLNVNINLELDIDEQKKEVIIKFYSPCFDSLTEIMNKSEKWEECISGDLTAFRLLTIRNVVHKIKGDFVFDGSKKVIKFSFPLVREYEKIFDKIDLNNLKMQGSMLLVEDNDDVLKFLSIFLKKIGFYVTTAQSGEQALQILKEETIDFILLDYLLPDITGADLLNTLEHSEKLPKIILMSGSSSVGQFSNSLVKAVLKKPFTLVELKDTLLSLEEQKN